MKESTPDINNFITEIIEEDIKNQTYNSSINPRFPPEPNGYLHIGHAKSIFLNFGIAKKYNGTCNLRFDDTNPLKESTDYINSIIQDVEWLLGSERMNKILYASDLGRIVNYYTNMVFSIEVISKSKSHVYISGGRYSNLLKNLGYRKTEAVGAAVNLNI